MKVACSLFHSSVFLSRMETMSQIRVWPYDNGYMTGATASVPVIIYHFNTVSVVVPSIEMPHIHTFIYICTFTCVEVMR